MSFRAGHRGGIRLKEHSFHEDLAYSHSQADHPMWHQIYRQAFPTMRAMVDVRQDGWAQRGGIDRVVTLNCGRTVTIDEKVRRMAFKDIHLEWGHEFGNGRLEPGWIEKDLACEYIAYAWQPLRIGYLLPFLQLREAWRRNGERWKGAFYQAEAKNCRYVSIGVCVPIREVLRHVCEAMYVSWNIPDDAR